MTAAEAAFNYLHLEATATINEAIAFAHAYEDAATAEDFDTYLTILETQLSNI